MPDDSFADADDLPTPDGAVLRAVLEDVPARVAAVSTQFRWIYANRKFRDFVGFAAETVIGRYRARTIADGTRKDLRTVRHDQTGRTGGSIACDAA